MTMAMTSEKIDGATLRAIAESAAKEGAKVVMAAVDKPRNISLKQGTDIVTDTDKASELACVKTIQEAFPGHAILGEEGGVLGDVNSDYLWCIDPLDGTFNFAHNYPGFCVSVGVLRHALPVAGCVIEFTGGPGSWSTRTFTAHRNGGATCDGKAISVSAIKEVSAAMLVTEIVHYDDLWSVMTKLLRTFSIQSGGVRCGGAAATNLCRVACGQADGYWQYNLKPWDVAAGVIILEEAGGRVTTADGTAYSVFDRSLLATNDALYPALLAVTERAHAELLASGADVAPMPAPEGYRVRGGAQFG